MKATKWFIYTVLIGAVPFFIRLFIWLVINNLPVSYVFNEVDMVTFGLVLHVSNINELEDKVNMEQGRKTAYVGLSTFLIVVFGAFLGIAYVADLETKTNIFNKQQIKLCTGVLSILSLLFSYSIYYRRKAEQNG